MDNFSSIEESQFFDAPDHISQEPDSVSDNFPLITNSEYDVWISAPQSVQERRRTFTRQIGLSSDEFEQDNILDLCEHGDINSNTTDEFCSIADSQRIMEDSGTILRSSEDEFSSSRSSLSVWNTENLDLNEARHGSLSFSGENEKGQSRDFSQSSPSVTQRRMSKGKYRWLSKLRSTSCMRSVDVKGNNVVPSRVTQRIRVRNSWRRRSKEISALFAGQDIKAHNGAINAMKFSHDGQYLASAGEDKVVIVWQVVEDERLDMINGQDLDPSCLYFTENHLSGLKPVRMEKDIKSTESKKVRITQDSACVVFPRKVFRVLENPLHLFEGHNGEILDLSWSKNDSLLSSSVDKTVRLWRVGVDQCIKIFPHSDYVTCVHFDPVNDNYFISGSIDGKIRIWAVSDCKVVDWTETSEIITAVSYQLDGQRCIVGSITGTCSLFDLSGNHFQSVAQICLTSKKKSPCQRITTFQFLPQDPSKILVTCADSNVRIIDGMNVIGKYKGGLRREGNHISASFTSNGRHIISASDDSNVYIWNYTNQSKTKAVKSFECFSSDASIAIPWPGPRNPPPFSPSNYFSLSKECLLYPVFSKGSVTWPEEKLPASSLRTLSKSQYNFFEASRERSSGSHAWGLVIITAGWDGRIRSFHNYGLPVSL